MKKTGKFPLVIFLIGASLLAACGQAAVPTANASAPAVVSVPPAAGASSPAVTSPAPTATPSPEPTVAPPPALTLADCTLLSLDQIGTVLGEAVVTDSEVVEGPFTRCEYKTDSWNFNLTFDHGTGSGASFMEIYRNTFGDKAITIPGLGDDAIGVSSDASYLDIYLIQGNSKIIMDLSKVKMVVGGTPPNPEEKEKALTELLFSHLP